MEKSWLSEALQTEVAVLRLRSAQLRLSEDEWWVWYRVAILVGRISNWSGWSEKVVVGLTESVMTEPLNRPYL